MNEPSLSQKHCIPCEGGVPKVTGAHVRELQGQLEGWQVVADHHLHRVFAFPDFKSALALVNRVGDVAEEQGHHPDICLSWGRAEIEIYTHAIDGLSENDFILAAKIDTLV